jgi:hypothetical protein
VTNPEDRLLPHPDAGWYDRTVGTTGGGLGYSGRSLSRTTPKERRSFARFVLAGNGGGYTWELRQLADWDPAALGAVSGVARQFLLREPEAVPRG